MGIEEHVARRCPCCDSIDVEAGHACTHLPQRRGAQEKQHQSFLHPISGRLKRLETSRHVEGGGALHDGQEPARGHRRAERRSSGRSELRVRGEVILNATLANPNSKRRYTTARRQC